MPSSAARPSSISTKARSSPISRWRTSSRRPSTPPAGCSASPSPSATTCPSTIPTCAPGRSPTGEAAIVGLFLGDYFARTSKRSGAWMSGFRDQEKLAGDVRPIVVNVMNFSKAAEGQPALLELRRRPHPVPRIRPRAARPPLGRDLPADRRHRASRAISSSSPRSSSSTGWSSRSCWSASPSTGAPASPCPRRC